MEKKIHRRTKSDMEELLIFYIAWSKKVSLIGDSD